MLRRRSFLAQIAAAATVPTVSRAAPLPQFIDVMRPPDHITIHSAAAGSVALTQAPGVEVTAEPARSGNSIVLPIYVSSPRVPIERICLRWQGAVSDEWRLLGDHWERSYGDLEWRCSVPNRVMPWYFLATSGSVTHGAGVKTGCAAFCSWQTDPQGISLWLDLRNGGSAVQLGQRRLHAATVVANRGEAPFQTAHDLCGLLCAQPRLSDSPVYGGNNWYYAYGNNTNAHDILRDSDLLASLAPSGATNRPFMVIDMGWSEAPDGAAPLAKGNAGFPDLPGLAKQMKEQGVRPGIWVRPLLTVETIPDSWRLSGNNLSGALKAPFSVIDPSIPEALEHVRSSIRGVREFGFELIKHDYSTYDILGRWGFQMNPDLTNDGWHFSDRTRTTAEIILSFYQALRDAVGNAMLLGCNTVGHLGAGLFELQRIGDDTSGRDWERTRKMGVNTLAFRLPQHGSFFDVDADCVAVTPDVTWERTRQWLDLVARSGTALFVSADPKATGPEQKEAIKAAFALAARRQPAAEPVGWLNTTAPENWRFGDNNASYQWYGDQSASPLAK